MNSTRTIRLARMLLAFSPYSSQGDQRFEVFSSNLKQEVAKWQKYEMNAVLQALTKHATQAGFSQQEIQKIRTNFQTLAMNENMQTAIEMVLNSPDIIYDAGQV
jgi:hypothetical protein